MHPLHIAAAPLLLAASAPSPVERRLDPLLFFVGSTESVGRVNVIFQKEYGTHSTGEGRIESDGSLLLIQQVFDDGKSPHERRWHIRQVGPGRYTGTMSEAVGPVMIDKVGERYRFRFAMDGRLSVEQMMASLPGGRLASSSAKIRKFGFVVATTDGIVRRL
jgi:hypothetical protein